MEHDATTSSIDRLTFTDIFGPVLSREETLEWIKEDPALYKHFLSFPRTEQERILSFIAGQKGLKISYDPFFQRILSPTLHPERLESFLSEFLQKLGIYFPGERSSCYAADAIMRQYTELKNALKDDFSYKKMKPFYLVVLMEQSSSSFKKVAPHYIHTEQISYDSGAIVSSL